MHCNKMNIVICITSYFKETEQNTYNVNTFPGGSWLHFPEEKRERNP